MSDFKQRVPRLRFPGFTGEWEVRKLGDICEILNSRRKPITAGDRKKGDYPYYGASGVIDFVDNYIFDEQLVLVGEDGAKWGQFEQTAFIAKGKYWVNNHAHVLKTIAVNDIFLKSYLIMIDLSSHITGNAPPKLTLNNLKKIPIPIPSLAEQQKIADCFASIDDLITAQTQKIDALKKHKQALLQKLFPAEGASEPILRFPGFTGEWEVRKLGDLCTNIFNGGTPSTEKLEYWNGDILWLTPAEMGENKNQFVYDTNRKITQQGLKNCSSKLLPVNSVILSTRAPIGHLAINKKETAINQGCRGLIPKESLDYKFLYYCLLISKAKLINLGSGSTFRELSGQELKNFQITFPSLSEQQKIATCLSTLDDLISAERQKHIALKNHKKALLQQLFPQQQ